MDVFRAQDAAAKLALQLDLSGKGAKEVRDGYENFLSRTGLNNDNLLSGGTYEFNLVTRNRVLLEAAYRGSWIVGRVIDSRANDMTRGGIEITTQDDSDLKKFHREMTRKKVWQSINTTIKWGDLYGGALGILQIKGQDLATPLDVNTVAKGQFDGIAVFDRWMLNPVLTPVIRSGPDVGLPEFYQIVSNPQSYDPSVSQIGSMIVHHSRVIRLVGIELPFYQAITENMWGESVLERMWDRLISFDNASLSSAQLVDRANLRTVQIDGLRETIAAGGDAYEGLISHFNMMRQFAMNEGLTLLDKEDVFASTAYSFAGLSDMMLQQAQQVSGAAEIPLVVLFSQTPSGLGASAAEDLRIYYDSINAKQEAKLRDPVSTIIEVVWRSVYGKPTPDDLDFEFNSLWQMTALDQANVAKTTAETVIGAYSNGLTSQATTLKELRDKSRETGLFVNITDEDIAAADEEPPAPDVEPTEEDVKSLYPGTEPVKPKEEPVKALDRKSSVWRKLAEWMVGQPEVQQEFGFRERV